MDTGPKIAQVAALVGDPARANMLSALMDGRTLTATELAYVSGVAPQTASGHLARLSDAGLLALERQGRRRYFRLASPLVARMLEEGLYAEALTEWSADRESGAALLLGFTNIDLRATADTLGKRILPLMSPWAVDHGPVMETAPRPSIGGQAAIANDPSLRKHKAFS